MAKKIIKGVFGGGKKKAAAEPTGPIVTPLEGTRKVNSFRDFTRFAQDLEGGKKKRVKSAQTAGLVSTILAERLGDTGRGKLGG